MSGARIEVEPIHLRLRAPIHTAHGPLHEREGLIVHARADGLEGLGEVAILPGFGAESLAQALDRLRTIQLHTIELADLEGWQGFPATRAALEVALLDL